MNNFDYYAGWYERDMEFLQQLFHHDWQLVAGLLAATSPQVRMITSWNWTMRIYRDYISGRKVRMDGLHKCHRSNVRHVLAGERLSGRKVRAFYNALTGDSNAVVLDVWMLQRIRRPFSSRSVASPPGSIQPGSAGTPMVAQMRHVSPALRSP